MGICTVNPYGSLSPQRLAWSLVDALTKYADYVERLITLQKLAPAFLVVLDQDLIPCHLDASFKFTRRNI